MEYDLREQLLESWVGLTGILKNSRLTKELSYNEAIVMLMVYRQYCSDGIGVISMRDVISKTKMLKSLANRTVNSLEKNGYIKKERNPNDSRIVNIRFVSECADVFLGVHNTSLELAGHMLEVIGEEDAKTFVNIYRKIALSEQKTKFDKE
ncbi:MAG: winged helix-turn-helix transcriptional regulator [Oscillospiraceae bacterium]|nr:winged helix-turn-helix transcriptional regulator [Oscillospiraceae bacterium]